MSSSSAAATFSLDYLQPSPTEQLCYVHCNFCDTVLAVSVPYTSLFKTVTVRCGHCSNLLSVNMRALHLPPPTNQIQLGMINNTFLSPTSHINSNLLEEITCPPPSLPPPPQPSSLLDYFHHQQQQDHSHHQRSTGKESIPPTKRTEDSIQLPTVNRPPEKRQRVPSAYNRFIKDEIQRIKAGNPDITHREAFSAAAKNWAHFPHIHFGLMPDQGLKNNNMCQDVADHENMILKDGFYAAAAAAAAANMGVTPF